MKSFLYSFSFCLLGIFTLSSCNKEVGENSLTHTSKSTSGPGIEYVLTCQGGCDNPEVECTHQKRAQTVYECNCDNCYFVIEIVGETGWTEDVVEGDSAKALAAQLFQGYEHGFKEELDSFLVQKNIDEGDLWEMKRIVVREEGFFGIRYEIVDKSGQLITVSFISEGVDLPTYRVNCSGGCNDAQESCRERWVLGSPPSAECSCEGACEMTIVVVQGRSE